MSVLIYGSAGASAGFLPIQTLDCFCGKRCFCFTVQFTVFPHLIVPFLCKGTVAVYKALVRMKPPLCMPGPGMHHPLNYPKVCLSKGWFTITNNHVYSLTSNGIKPRGEFWFHLSKSLRFLSPLYFVVLIALNYTLLYI